MAEQLTLEVPDEVMAKSRLLAAKTQRSPEEVLVDWVRQAAEEPAFETLSDEELLAFCDQEPSPEEEELSDLLDRNRESDLGEGEQVRLQRIDAEPPGWLGPENAGP
jgi:predicted transcriptional regulator